MESKMAVVGKVCRARGPRGGEKEACCTGTRPVTRAMCMDAGGAGARAHAGTCPFDAWNTPVQSARTAPSSCRAFFLNDTLFSSAALGVCWGRLPVRSPPTHAAASARIRQAAALAAGCTGASRVCASLAAHALFHSSRDGCGTRHQVPGGNVVMVCIPILHAVR